MSRRGSAPRPPKTSRRWHIPLPLIHGSETLEGGSLLNELPDETGLVLWQLLRDVLLWAQAPGADRPRLFASGPRPWDAAVDRTRDREADLREPLAVLSAVFRDPDGTAAVRAAAACRQIAEWAEAAGKLGTALAFAQNAALLCPSDPQAAFAAGRIARMAADHARAEVWFRRSVGLARRARNWRVYSHAFLGLGRLAKERGNYPAARHQWTRALRGAQRGGLRTEKGVALHNLCVAAIETGHAPEATRLARAALGTYGPGHERLSALAHDVAYGWMEQGCYRRSLPVFRALLPHLQKPLEALFVWANIARAAAGSAERDSFDESFHEVERRIGDPRVAEGEARALLDLARGAAHLASGSARPRWRAGDSLPRRLAARLRCASRRRRYWTGSNVGKRSRPTPGSPGAGKPPRPTTVSQAR